MVASDLVRWLLWRGAGGGAAARTELPLACNWPRGGADSHCLCWSTTFPCFDDAALRKGRPTVHGLWGSARAAGRGCALLARSFELLSSGPRHTSRRCASCSCLPAPLDRCLAWSVVKSWNKTKSLAMRAFPKVRGELSRTKTGAV